MTALATPQRVDLHNCKRVRGGSVRDCLCRLPDGGWLECPTQTRGVGVVITVDAHRRITGELCADCGSFSTVRAGTCMLCLDCGSTSGGCS